MRYCKTCKVNPTQSRWSLYCSKNCRTVKRSRIYQCSDEQFGYLVARSQTYSDILRSFNMCPSGGSSVDILKTRIEKLGLSIEHFVKSWEPSVHVTRIPLTQILVKNSDYANISRLKARLVSEHILEYKCALCGNAGSWKGHKLTLTLDHKNGDNKDHTKDNLRFLCPNCHSQTETFAGKNKNRGVR